MRMYIVLLVLFITASGAMADTLEIQDDVIADLLARAHVATVTTPMYYEETTYSAAMGDVQLTTRRVWQASADRFRAESVDETGRTVLTIADGSQVWVVDTATRSVLREELTHPSLHAPTAGSTARGRIAQETFADRPVYMVTLRGDRQQHKYTIDMATHIVLKEEIVGPDGALVYMAYRSNLRLGADFDPALFIYHPSPDQQVLGDRTAWRTQRIVRDLSIKSGFTVHVPKQIPAGYELLDGSVHYIEDDAVVALHFHKGRAVLSLFQQQHPISNDMVRFLLKRLTSDSGRELSAAKHVSRGRSYLAIGPLSERELNSVLTSMEPLAGE